MGLDAIILVFWMLSFKPAFSLSSFTFNKRLFSLSSLSAVRLVSPAYLSQTSSEFLSFCFHLGSLRSRNWNTIVGGVGLGITPALDWFPLKTFFFFNIRNDYTSSLFKDKLFWILITYNQTSLQFRSVAQSRPTLCDSMNHSGPGLPVHHQHLESTQTKLYPNQFRILRRVGRSSG